MKGLIEALLIFIKYGDPSSPTHCEHDVLTVMIDPALVSEADKARLEELGFSPGYDDWAEETFQSFRYGSA